ncbi:IS110 family transposase [Jeongeupia wiesaeckerbachi]|uniref:IS110 family transposase n=1 Tax=Jeongeupia wiesaeckerbachi TaxID=3051218 RepID=UPI003D805B6D
MKLMRIGIDLAKNVFQLHGVARDEQTVLRKQLTRDKFLAFLRDEVDRSCDIGMEACGGAHHWGRQLQQLGFNVKLIAPQFVKPYVKRQKNDANDAAAICEAMSRPSMRFVRVKTVEQEDIQAVHRIRSELVHQRTAKANQIRGLLAERGLVVAQRIEQLCRALPRLYDDQTNGLSCRFRRLLGGLWQDLHELDGRIKELDREISLIAQSNPAAQRLQGIPGIGPISATALVAAIGDGRQFKCGRDLAAWLGLVPRQHSSGGKERLLGICKRGDAYLRTLLIHGARAVLRQIGAKMDGRSQWLRSLTARRPANVAAVALANKNARIAWALLTKEEDYQIT